MPNIELVVGNIISMNHLGTPTQELIEFYDAPKNRLVTLTRHPTDPTTMARIGYHVYQNRTGPSFDVSNQKFFPSGVPEYDGLVKKYDAALAEHSKLSESRRAVAA